MQWENLTSLDFEQAVETCDRVGILPIGVLEPHGPHLPLGTDMFEAHAVACRAASQEPAIVFPAYPYGINHESAHLPGSVVIRRDLVLALLENVCDEMGRQGLTKIILFSGHGGNRWLVPLFVQTLVESTKPYTVYEAHVPVSPEAKEVLETEETGHACESETSRSLYLHPDLVRMDQIPPEPFSNLKRNADLRDVGAYSPMDWYAMYPAMYVGNASKATAEKGRPLFESRVVGLVDLIRRVKADTTTPELQREFYERMRAPTSPDVWTKSGE
ncbi:MAG: creatininase family protein [Anaerolineae bacterium]